MNCEKLVARWTFRKYSRKMRSQLRLFPRAASLAISLASERSKSFKGRRAPARVDFVYGRARKKRREDSRKIRLSNGTGLGTLKERMKKRKRAWPRVRSDLFRSPRPLKYTCRRRRRIFIQIVKLFLRDFARGKSIGKFAVISSIELRGKCVF